MERFTGGSAKIYFGQRYLKPQIHVDLFRTRILERSAGSSVQIHLGQL